jgi:hypothetical protein
MRPVASLPILLLLACGAGSGASGGPGQIGMMPPASKEKNDPVEVANGAYLDWSSFKPGTWVRTKQVLEQPEGKRESTSVTRLIERTPSRVLVQYGDSPAGKVAFGATTSAPADQSASRPSSQVGEGDETLEIRGRTILCHWREYRLFAGGSTCALKTWRSRVIPGALVKNEQVWTRSGVLEQTMSTVVVDWHLED